MENFLPSPAVKSFENWPTFGTVMNVKSGCFLTHSVGLNWLK